MADSNLLQGGPFTTLGGVPTYTGTGAGTVSGPLTGLGTGTQGAAGAYTGSGAGTVSGTFFGSGQGIFTDTYAGVGAGTVSGAFTGLGTGVFTTQEFYVGSGAGTVSGSFFGSGQGLFTPQGAYTGAGSGTVSGLFTGLGAGLFSPAGQPTTSIYFGDTEISNIKLGDGVTGGTLGGIQITQVVMGDGVGAGTVVWDQPPPSPLFIGSSAETALDGQNIVHSLSNVPDWQDGDMAVIISAGEEAGASYDTVPVSNLLEYDDSGFGIFALQINYIILGTGDTQVSCETGFQTWKGASSVMGVFRGPTAVGPSDFSGVDRITSGMANPPQFSPFDPGDLVVACGFQYQALTGMTAQPGYTLINSIPSAGGAAESSAVGMSMHVSDNGFGVTEDPGPFVGTESGDNAGVTLKLVLP